MTIRSKSIKRGDENESSWPPVEPQRGAYHAYIDPKTGKLTEGYPPLPEVFDMAPYVIFDSMPPQYHEAAKMQVDSRKTWKLLDKMHGTITFSPHENSTPPDDSAAEKRARREDIREARRRAVAEVKQGSHPLTDEQKALCRLNDQKISQQLGFNVKEIWQPKKTRLRGSKPKPRKSARPKK